MKKSTKKTIVLLDAHAILHRGFHAMAGFSTRDGRPTGALYGFITMVLKIYEDIKPDYIAACFDLPKPTFRHTSYEGYKQGRAKTDDALISQIQEAYKLCEALSIPVYICEGFEADDLLGTIAEQLKTQKNTRIIIASGDMDTFQLIDRECVTVYTLRKGNETALFNEEGVKERYGFGPAMIPDYKGLAGDPSDNIIGISGIGDKTATELIKKYGKIEDIYKVLKKNRQRLLDDGFKERVVKLLEEGEEEALFSKTLATIIRDVPIKYQEPENSWLESLSIENYQKMCDLYEFRSLRGRLQKIGVKDALAEVTEPIEEIEGEMLEELKIMTNLLHSESTNPTMEDMQIITGKKTAEEMKSFLEAELQKEKLWDLFVGVEKPIMYRLREMEKNGIALDVVKLNKLSIELHIRVKELEKKIFKCVGEEFNISSPKQLGVILFEKLNLGTKIKKTKSGAASTNAKELEKIKDEHIVVPMIFEYREMTKLLSTYIDTLPQYVKADGKIHAHFIQTGASTGRFACEDPNLQNLPIKSELGQKVRESFVASKGNVLLSCDYSQIDLRAAAILSGDKNLVEIFKSKTDVHAGTAARVFGVKESEVTDDMRRKAKAINFGILYGMGVTALKENMKVERKEAQEFYDQYKKTFSRLMDYLEEVKASTFKLGYTETLLGRRREVPLLKSPLPFLRAQGERIAINAPMQGTAADILKLAMIDANEYVEEKKLGDKVKLVMQIHDELVFEIDKHICEDVADELVKVLEKVLSKRKLSDLPLKVSRTIGANLQAL
ncbi:MAG: polymerase [Candidatus Nomurabacteria bacterium]|nr:polymerase [Candidatus Nomurabacteria bacterium]